MVHYRHTSCLPACLLHAPQLASTTSKQVFSSKVIDAAIV
jgi:hypothetical protein